MDRVVRTNNVHRTSQSPLVIRDWSVDRLQVQVTDQIFKWAGQPERKPFATQTQHSALLLRYQKHKIVQVPPGGLAQFKSNSIPEQKKNASTFSIRHGFRLNLNIPLPSRWTCWCCGLPVSTWRPHIRSTTTATWEEFHLFPNFLGWKILFFSLSEATAATTGRNKWLRPRWCLFKRPTRNKTKFPTGENDRIPINEFVSTRFNVFR